MVRDGIFYALGLLAAAAAIFVFSPWLAVLPVALAGFFLWFFRDPQRTVPQEAGAIVSPADGKVTDISSVELAGIRKQKISIFLNVFDVHVNRSPISGIVRNVEYRRGRFCNAMKSDSCEINEQNIVTVEGEGQSLIFKQIAGLLARRIVFNKHVGDHVARGERVGLIKFGSRVDVLMDAGVDLKVKVGDRVAGGSSILALNRAAVDRSRPGSTEVPSVYSGSPS